MQVNILRVRSIGVAANAQTYLLGGRIWVKIKQEVWRRSAKQRQLSEGIKRKSFMPSFFFALKVLHICNRPAPDAETVKPKAKSGLEFLLGKKGTCILYFS